MFSNFNVSGCCEITELLTLQCRNVTTLKSTSSFDQEVEEESKFSFYILSVHWLCDGHHSTNGPFQWSETRGLLPLPVQCAKFNVWRRTIWEYQLQKQWNVAVKIRAISNLSELCLIFNTWNLCSSSKYLQKLIYKRRRIEEILMKFIHVISYMFATEFYTFLSWLVLSYPES